MNYNVCTSGNAFKYVLHWEMNLKMHLNPILLKDVLKYCSGEE